MDHAPSPAAPLRLVLMGVSGCGKSTVGRALADRLGIPFRDGDDLHPAGNVALMRAGTPLTDADRWPWLDRVAAVLRDAAPVIVACTALRRAYRDRLRAGAGGPVTIFHLSGTPGLIADRLAARRGHFMPPGLLDSQFAALEVPDAQEAVTIDISPPLQDLVGAIVARLPQGHTG